MIAQSLLTKVLVQTFEEKAGKFQIHSKDGQRRALKTTFSLSIDHDKEEGYRHLDVVIYGPMNYIGVVARERWTVVPLEGLEDDDDGGLKPGYDYTDGATPWKLYCYHDSGWRTDGIDEILKEYGSRIIGFTGPSFYQVVEVPPEIEALIG